jgi:hypothetical protein
LFLALSASLRELRFAAVAKMYVHVMPILATAPVLSQREPMKNTKFLVKVNRGGARAAEYVLRIDRTPIQTTTNKKLALAMGRFTAEDAVKLMSNSRCTPELISVFV